MLHKKDRKAVGKLIWPLFNAKSCISELLGVSAVLMPDVQALTVRVNTYIGSMKYFIPRFPAQDAVQCDLNWSVELNLLKFADG